jgi:hypothetical protein
MTDTSPTLAHDANGIVDFTTPRDIRRFRIDADVFECAPAVPVNLARKLSKMRGEFVGIDPDRPEDVDPVLAERMMDVVIEILDEIMLPASAKRFAERMGSIIEPIDSRQLVKVANWLMEDLAERPTQQEPDSSASSTPTPTSPSSTDGVPLEVSIPPVSPLPVY